MMSSAPEPEGFFSLMKVFKCDLQTVLFDVGLKWYGRKPSPIEISLLVMFYPVAS